MGFSKGKQVFFRLLSVLVVVLLIGGCGSQQAVQKAEESVKFKIGHCTWVGYGPLYIAKEKGFFKKYNIDPEMVIIEDESQYAAALASNRIQALGNVIDRDVIHYASGVDAKFVCAMDESYGGDGIIASGDIKTVKDLEGKTVGLDKASTSYFFFLAVLNKYGVDEKKVNIQEMTAGDAGAAFVAGKLDAAVVWEPWLTKASQRPGGHVLVSSRDFPGYIVDVISVRQDFIEKHPEAVLGLVKAWNDAVEYYQAHPDEGNEIMGKALSLSKEEVADMAQGIKFMGKEENKKFFDKSQSEHNIYYITELACKFWTEKGVLEKPVDPEEIIVSRFVQEATR